MLGRSLNKLAGRKIQDIRSAPGFDVQPSAKLGTDNGDMAGAGGIGDLDKFRRVLCTVVVDMADKIAMWECSKVHRASGSRTTWWSITRMTAAWHLVNSRRMTGGMQPLRRLRSIRS